MDIIDRLSRLPEFQCHKVVRAARIVGQILPPVSQLELDPGDKEEPRREGESAEAFAKRQENVWHEVPAEFFTRHRPQTGGYFVVYEGGYQSYSPAEAFETGYVSAEQARTEEHAHRFTAEKLEDAKARIVELEEQLAASSRKEKRT